VDDGSVADGTQGRPDEAVGPADQRWGEEVKEGSGVRPRPGDIIAAPELRVQTEPLVGPDHSTPLDDDEPQGTIPPSPLWAMKDRRHIQWHLLPAGERHPPIRDAIGDGDETVYIIDDGHHHVMVGRRVGGVEGECEYCLVGRQPIALYESLQAGRTAPSRAFEGAAELTLCGVAREEGVLSSNVFDVTRYSDAGAVPADFLPGAPYRHFTSALEITAG
jgi:hypothetical protein